MGIENFVPFLKDKKEDIEIGVEVKEAREKILADFNNQVDSLKKDLITKGGMTQEEATKVLKEKFDYTNSRFLQGYNSEALN